MTHTVARHVRGLRLQVECEENRSSKPAHGTIVPADHLCRPFKRINLYLFELNSYQLYPISRTWLFIYIHTDYSLLVITWRRNRADVTTMACRELSRKKVRADDEESAAARHCSKV